MRKLSGGSSVTIFINSYLKLSFKFILAKLSLQRIKFMLIPNAINRARKKYGNNYHRRYNWNKYRDNHPWNCNYGSNFIAVFSQISLHGFSERVFFNRFIITIVQAVSNSCYSSWVYHYLKYSISNLFCKGVGVC